MSTLEMRQHVKWFRDSSPYINAHRDRRFVIYLSGAALADSNLTNIIGDITLLSSLGVKLVLVHGATPQINHELANRGIEENYRDGIRITDAATLDCVLRVTGKLRIELEAAFSMGLINSPMHGSDVRITSGNFVRAKPLGVIAGCDYQHTGEVRKIHAGMIKEQLDRGATVLLSPVGYSPSGEIFNLDGCDLATRVATDLYADKLIFLGSQPGILEDNGELVSELQTSYAAKYLGSAQSPDMLQALRSAVLACQKGVARCHLVSFSEDGAMLEELFTRDGAGTQVCRESYEQIKVAAIDDVNGIINLIRPLEEEGFLVRRSRELLESEIERFTVIIRDSAVVGCAALYPFGTAGELACLVTHPEYRNSERGDALLQTIEKSARDMNIDSLFVLTTRSGHWFMERGFRKSSPDQLPMAKKELYNYQRNSTVLIKSLI